MESKQQEEKYHNCDHLPEEFQALLNAKMFKAVAGGHMECLNRAIAAGAKVNDLDEGTGERKEILDAYLGSCLMQLPEETRRV